MKISANMEIVQNQTIKMSAYGIDVSIPTIVLMLLANVETATKHKYGREFQSAMQVICTMYAHNYA